MEHEWLTTTEVAEMLRVKPATVADWCNKGRYPKKYLMRSNGNARGSKWLIHRDALKPKEPAARQYWVEKQRAAEAVARLQELLAPGRRKKSQ